MAGQGGSATGCGIPLGPATAVIINLAAVNPAGGGNLRAWAVASPQPPAPLASVLNYGVVAGLPALANGIAVPICDAATTSCPADLRLQANASGTDVVGDVVGYFRKYVPQVVLRSGQTVFGSIGGMYPGSAGEAGATASLPLPAPVGLDDAHVQVLGADGTVVECPGTALNPAASPGFVCIYPFAAENAIVPVGFIWGAGDGTKVGFQVSWYANNGTTIFFANWAYTAP